MTSEQIREKLDNMYTGTSSRGFINHMIKAYFPMDKVEKVWETPKGKFRCAITNEPLFSVNDMLTVLHSEETKNAFMEGLKAAVDKPSDKISVMTDTIKDAIKNKKMGLTGKDTDTFISQPAYQEFFNWLTNKILTGDKHINWVVRQMRDNAIIDKIEDALPEEDKGKVKSLRTIVQKPKTATFADLEVLQQLKAKFEAEAK